LTPGPRFRHHPDAISVAAAEAAARREDVNVTPL
jgi:hypothetical protein